MFTLVGYSQSQDTSGVLTAMNALADPHVRVNGADVIVPQLNQVIAAWAGGATISQAQLQSPTLRRQNNIDIGPLSVSAGVAAVPTINDFRAAPIALAKDEALDFFVAETAAGAEREHGFVWLSDGNIAPVGGQVFTIRATGTTTLTAFAWTACTLTFAQTLPAGTYAVVGLTAFGATMVAARLIFVGYNWRPGQLGNTTVGSFFSALTDPNACGEYGRFAHNTPPQLEVYATAADTAETVYLDLVKVA